MFSGTSLWGIGAGVLGVALGVGFGSLVAPPPAPDPGSGQETTAAPGPPPAREAVDVARLASALGEQLAASEPYAALVESLRHELRGALEEELALALAQVDAKRPAGHVPPPLSEAARQEQQQALASAQSAFEDARARGRFDPERSEEWNMLFPLLDPDDQYELSRQLAVALNNGEIHFDDPSELPLF